MNEIQEAWRINQKKKKQSKKIKRVFNWRPEGARRRSAAVTSYSVR